jgi:ubiquinone/menaquinone biosynthesis C-methylase UbiE
MTDTSAIWTGEAVRYHQVRPTPPPVLLDMLTQLIHLPHPALVVDLGSGTGLSTVAWGKRAERVIGIEPNDDMRNVAIQALAHHPEAAHIEFRAGVSEQIDLPDKSADIVTCSQSLHWMEPSATLAEVARILRPGGVFAAYDYDWPPAIHWELEQVFQDVDERFEQLAAERKLNEQLPRWPKEQHLARMRASGHFRFTRALLLHHVELGDAQRFIDLLMTNTYSHQFKLHNLTEEEIGFARLRQAALDYIGTETIPWYFSYQVRLGIR